MAERKEKVSQKTRKRHRLVDLEMAESRSNTQTHRNFVSEPVGNKPVTEVPGIGKSYGEKLAQAGYTEAKQLVYEYAAVKGDQQKFTSWLGEKTHGTENNMQKAYDGIKEYVDQHPLPQI